MQSQAKPLPSNTIQGSLETSTDDNLINQILEAEEQSANYDRIAKRAKEELLRRHQDTINQQLSTKEEPFGSVTLVLGNFKVTFTTPKKVDWDQDKLANVAKMIQADGGDPTEYIKIKYEVSETAYKVWGSNIKAHFKDARTVKPGSVALKIADAA